MTNSKQSVRSLKKTGLKVYTSDSEHAADLLNKASDVKLNMLREQIDKEVSMTSKRFQGDMTLFKAKIERYHQAMTNHTTYSREFDCDTVEDKAPIVPASPALKPLVEVSEDKRANATKHSNNTMKASEQALKGGATAKSNMRRLTGAPPIQTNQFDKKDAQNSRLWNMSMLDRRRRIRQIAERKYLEQERREQELERISTEGSSESQKNGKQSKGSSKFSKTVELKIEMRRKVMREKAEKKFAILERESQLLSHDKPGNTSAFRQSTYVVSDVKRSAYLPLPNIKSIPENSSIDQDTTAEQLLANNSTSQTMTSHPSIAFPRQKDDITWGNKQYKTNYNDFKRRVPQRKHYKALKKPNSDAIPRDRSLSEADAMKEDTTSFSDMMRQAADMNAHKVLKSRKLSKLPEIKASSCEPQDTKHNRADAKQMSTKLADVKEDAKVRYSKLEEDLLYFMERQKSFNVKHPVLHPHNCYALQRNETKVNGMLRKAASVNADLKPIKRSEPVARKAWLPVGV